MFLEKTQSSWKISRKKLAMQQLLGICKQTSHVSKRGRRTLMSQGQMQLTCHKENAVGGKITSSIGGEIR